jgi:hypothetical protein
MSAIIKTIGRTHDGGSCARCDRDYRGAPYDRDIRGVRVLSVIEPGVEEPINLCMSCYQEESR